jgi:hypothetical protein
MAGILGMARSTDSKKVALWEGRFRRFVGSGLSVARFCAAEGVSEALFYYWQKKLGPPKRRWPARARHRAHTRACREAGAEDGRDASKGRRAGAENRRDGFEDRHDGHAEATGCGMFRPVTVVSGTCGLVVRLPGGTRIEVNAAHLDAIRAVVAETVRADHDLTSVHGACDNVPDSGRRSPSDNHLIRTNDEAVSC